MLTAAGTHTIDFSAAAMRGGAQRNPMVSVIIDGGAHDDVEYGSGFAHLREHWALASLRRMYGDRLVMCSAKTLQYQTELLLFVDSSAATPPGHHRLVAVDRGGDLAHEVSVIDEEIVSAESEAVGCAFDRELPRRLGVYGPRDGLGGIRASCAPPRVDGRQPGGGRTADLGGPTAHHVLDVDPRGRPVAAHSERGSPP